MLDQGQKVYAAIFKRIWRGMKEEFKKIYHLNAIFLPLKQTFGEGGIPISREDYIGSANRRDPGCRSQRDIANPAGSDRVYGKTGGYDNPRL